MRKLYLSFLILLVLSFTQKANAQPANDNCAAAISLTPAVGCTPTNGTNVQATQSIPSLTCAGFTSTSALDVWYSFVATSTFHTITVVGAAGFDAIVDLRSGACNGTNIGCADATVGGGTEVINAPGLSIGTTYLIRVYGWAGGTGAFTICVATPPAVSNDNCATAVSLTPTVACTPTNGSNIGATQSIAPLTCAGFTSTSALDVWYSFVATATSHTITVVGATGFDAIVDLRSGACNGTNIACADATVGGGTETINAPGLLIGTTYYVRVYGWAGGTGNFTICVFTPPLIPNDNCSGAITINCGQTINGSTALATIDAVGTCVTALGTAPGVWYKLTGDGSVVTLSLCGSLYDTKIGVFSGTCAALTCVTGNDDFAGCGLQSQVTFPTVFGTEYLVLVTGFGSGSGAFTLARTCAFPNELCAGAITINCGQTINGTTAGAAVDPVGTCVTSLGTAPGLWYTFVGDGSAVTLATCGGITAYDTKLGVFSGSCTSLVCVTGNDDFGGACGSRSQVTFPTVFGTTYYILVTGFGANSGNFSLTRTCVAPCAGSPVAGTISGPATLCSGSPGTLTLNGFTMLPGISVQWRSSTVSGGPYTNIPNATSSTYSFTGNGITTYYVATVTCTNGGAPVNTPEFTVVQGAPAHSALNFTVTTACSPGTVSISGTAINGGPGNYTHVLTGPGTITPGASTGPNNSTGNFVVSNLPFGFNTFSLTSTDGIGCSVTSPITGVFIKQTPVITFSPAAPTICNGTIQPITTSVAPPVLTTFTQPGTTLIPANSPVNTSGNAGPYPTSIAVSGLPATGVTVKSVKLGNLNHSFPDDVDIVLVSPSGSQSVVLMSDVGGGAVLTGIDYTLDDSAPALMADAAFNPQGTYRPTNYGASDTYPNPGPGTVNQGTPTLSTFTGNPNGNWNLYIVDDAGGDSGFMGNWSITFNVPSLVSFTPVTGLFTDPAATVAYTGTPVAVIYAKPATTTTYTGSATVEGCTNTNTVTVTVNQLPVITTQPAPATQTVCPGFNVTYSVVATGTGLSYQWRRNGVALTSSVQYAGVNGPTLTISNVNSANSGNYDVVITGVCPPVLTSTAVTLNVATAPVISTQPANTTVCEGSNATFTVATVGSVPAPTIFQWQVSTNGGTTWTNLLVGGSFTPTLTVPAVTTAMNTFRYRILVTNSCGQTTTSNAVILTVNPRPVITASLLSNRICLSDTLVPLTATPVGGSWSGIGVSGFNFVPPSTAVGTYNLTYTATSNLGCVATSTIVAKVEDCPERIRELDDDGAVIIFPNPNNGKFNIRINSTLYNYLGMKVYNSQGQLVNGSINGGVFTSPTFGGIVYGRTIPIDLSSLPSGVYMVKLYYDNGQRSSEKGFKVIIAH